MDYQVNPRVHDRMISIQITFYEYLFHNLKKIIRQRYDLLLTAETVIVSLHLLCNSCPSILLLEPSHIPLGFPCN